MYVAILYEVRIQMHTEIGVKKPLANLRLAGHSHSRVYFLCYTGKKIEQALGKTGKFYCAHLDWLR